MPTFGRSKVTSSVVATMNLEFNSVCRRKKHWRLLECRFEQTFVRFLERFTKFKLLKEKPPKGYMWSGRRLTKIQATTRPDHIWPEVWTNIGEAAQNREKQEWPREKPKLDNARRMRGIHFIDPGDAEYKEIIKNVRRKLERPMAQAMPWKRLPNGITKVFAQSETASEKTPKTICGWTVESRESTKQWVEPSQPKYHENHMTGKGSTSMSHHKQVHPDATRDEKSRCKSRSGQEMEKARDDPSKKEVILEAQRNKKKSPLCHWWTYVTSKMRRWNQNYRNTEAESSSEGTFVKDDSGAYAAFTEQGSSASHMNAAKIMYVIARSPSCDGQAADAISAFSQVKLEDAPRLLKKS